MVNITYTRPFFFFFNWRFYRDIHQDNGELIDVVNKIHESSTKPLSCELTMKNNLPDEVIEVDPETDLLEPEIEVVDDLGNLIEVPEVSVDKVEVVQEASQAPVVESVVEPVPEVSVEKVEIVQTSQAPVELVESVIEPVPEVSVEKVNVAQESVKPLELVESVTQPVQSSTIESETRDYVTTPSSLVKTATEAVETATEAVETEPEVVDVPAQDGQPCSTSGQQQCVNEGTSGQWLTCNFDKWLVQDCSSGLVCKENQGNNNKRTYRHV